MIKSINEPDAPSRDLTLTPQSINEPLTLPDWAKDKPEITGIDPTECTIGDPSFDVVLEGTGFYEQSVIVFAGHDEPTTLTDGKLSTGVNMEVWKGPDTVQVSVRNGPIQSNEMPFTFNAAEQPAGLMPTVDPDQHPEHPEHPDHEADPDELEDELEQAREEGDFTPTHRSRKRR